MTSYLPLLISAAFATLMIILERIFPATQLPSVRGWWVRALLANLSQIGIVVLAGFTWNLWLRGHSLLLAARWPDALAAGTTYFLSTFIFYWWHRIPKNADKVKCGFSDERETLIPAMLGGREVDTKRDSEPLDFRPACFGCRKRHLCRTPP